MDENFHVRPVLWVASAKRDLMEMPKKVVEDFGYGLFESQMGRHPSIGKALKGFGGVSVMELVSNHHDGTFRVIYTAQFKDVVIVLHAFQKKSKKGIATPKQEIELIRSRLKHAVNLYSEWQERRYKNG